MLQKIASTAGKARHGPTAAKIAAGELHHTISTAQIAINQIHSTDPAPAASQQTQTQVALHDGPPTITEVHLPPPGHDPSRRHVSTPPSPDRTNRRGR